MDWQRLWRWMTKQQPAQPQAPQGNQELGPVYVATANLFALSTAVTYTRWFGMLAILIPLIVAAVLTDAGTMRVALASSAFVAAVIAALLLYHNSIFQGFRRKMGEELEAEITGQSLAGSSGFPHSFRVQRDLFDNHKRIEVGGQPWPPQGFWGGLKLMTTRLPHQADLVTATFVIFGTLAFLLFAALELRAEEAPSIEETQLVLLLEQYRLADEEDRQVELGRLLSFCDDRFHRADRLGKVCSSISGTLSDALDDTHVTILLRQLLE